MNLVDIGSNEGVNCGKKEDSHTVCTRALPPFFTSSHSYMLNSV